MILLYACSSVFSRQSLCMSVLDVFARIFFISCLGVMPHRSILFITARGVVLYNNKSTHVYHTAPFTSSHHRQTEGRRIPSHPLPSRKQLFTNSAVLFVIIFEAGETVLFFVFLPLCWCLGANGISGRAHHALSTVTGCDRRR